MKMKEKIIYQGFMEKKKLKKKSEKKKQNNLKKM